MKRVSVLVVLAVTLTVGATWAVESSNNALRAKIATDVTLVDNLDAGSSVLCAEDARPANFTDRGSGSRSMTGTGNCRGIDCQDIAVAGARCTAAQPKEHATLLREVPHALGE